MLGVAITVLIIVGCTSIDKRNSAAAGTTPTTTVPRIVIGNNDDDKARSLCSESLDKIEQGLANIRTGLGLVTSSSNTDVREFLSTSIEFVDTSIETVHLCDEYWTDSSAFLEDLHDLKAALEDVADLY